MGVIQYIVQCPICWPLGRIFKLRSQKRNICKMCAFIWPWLVLSSADVIIFFAQKSLNLKIALCYFKIKRKTVKQRWSR